MNNLYDWKEYEEQQLLEKCKLYQLSNNQIKIAKLLLSGLTIKEIAYKLCISEVTVKSHINRIYRKTKVMNTLEFRELMVSDKSNKNK